MKKFVLSALAVVVTVFALVSVPAAASAAPLKIAIAAADGSTKIKAAKKLKILVVCSKDCRAKATLKVKTPVASDTVKGGKALKANELWGTGMILTSTGVKLVKNNIAKSRFLVTITALDIETGKTVVKHKTLKFKK